MARTVRGHKGAAKKAAAKRAAPNVTAKAAVKKNAAPPALKRKAGPKRKAGLKKVVARAKPPVKKAAVKKAAVKKAPVKKVAARVPVARRPSVRRIRAAVASRPKAAVRRLKAVAPAQRFTVSHLNEADFKQDGLRPYALYRDLGIAAATGGLCQAHVIRLVPPCTDEVRKRHVHEAELQMVYVLKGWIKNEFEGEGTLMMPAGSCWLQPSGIQHTVLDYSADAELLEIIVPADFRTGDVD
jgi:uncharacterized RmlC-like cupin family protein